MRSKFLLFLFFSFFSLRGFSTHIIGGELLYQHLGNNNYKITLKVYRDCFNGQAAYDNPAVVGIFNSAGQLVDTLAMPFPGSTLLPITMNNPCYQAPNNVCVEEAVYVEYKKLPPLNGGYTLAYQRCCRNQTILNLVNPGAVGTTYTAYIPGPATASINSNPYYKNFPPIFLCAGVPFTFDHSAVDIDGDSLVYSLCDPYDGASQLNPMPIPPAAPPYNTVPFSNGFTGSYPMSSAPPLAINSQTGWMTGTPNQIGQWVVGVCVREYRKGVFLSENKRDFQFNVTVCPNTVVASVPSQTTFCNGFTVNFGNSSQNSSTYHWDFGDANVTNDTSNLFAPTWTYAQPGTYTVMLIANPGMTCADTAYSTFKVYPLLQPFWQKPPPQCITNNNFSFTAGGQFMGNGNSSFSWYFGNAANINSSSQQNPTGIKFFGIGKHLVKLTITENGCTRSYTDTITIVGTPVANFYANPVMGCVPFTVTFKDTTNPANLIQSYTWDFGDGSSTSNLPSPTHTYNNVGIYTVTLTVLANNGCTASYTFTKNSMVTVNPIPAALFGASPLSTSIFNPDITFTDQSSKGIDCFLYFGDGQVYNGCNFGSTSHAYQKPGHYRALQVLVNGTGCADTFAIDIEIRPEYRFFVPNCFTANGDGLNDVFMPKLIGVSDYTFMIFDRWGELIFRTNNTEEGWDGTYQQRPCQMDTYVYKFVFKDDVELRDHTFVGKVTLLR